MRFKSYINYKLLLLTLISLSTTLFAKVPVVPVSELVPEKRHERATEIILHIIKTYHYKKTYLNDRLSSTILDKYLESLDANRSFLTQEDINTFETYRYQLDESLNDTELEPAYTIFKVYRQRVAERVEYALEQLENDFDFNVEETYHFDRRDEPWPLTTKNLDEIWRKRVKNDYLNLKLAKKDDSEIKETLSKRYKRIKTSTFQLNSNDVYQTFINAYATSIEPHTAYFSPRTSENFDITMSLSLEGIGAVLTTDYDYTKVQSVVPGGPAELGGELHSEDKIIGVGQDMDGEIVDVIGWRLDDVVDLIRGPKDSIVRLELLPKGTGVEGPSKIISITRDKIKLEGQAAKSSVLDFPESGVKLGVIDVPTFYSDFAAQARGEKDYKSTSRDVRQLLKDLKQENIDGIIVDLRGNGGGSLAEALEFTGLFIESGPVVQTKDSSGKIDINNDPDPGIAYSGPMAVLVDRYSASASEIFAGAIQDYHRGIIIGEPTFGKGTVQNIVDLNRFIRRSDEDHGRLKTTIAQFFRISGGSNQHKGVIPDIIYPTFRSNDDHGERAYENALPWDKVKPARYVAASAPVDNFTEARMHHEKRIKSDELFQILLQQLNLTYETNERKVVSLLEEKRKKERDELETKRKDLENQFRIAQGLEPLPDEEETDNIPETEVTQDKQDPLDLSLEKISEEEEEDEELLDVLLNETANILIDLLFPDRVTALTQN